MTQDTATARAMALQTRAAELAYAAAVANASRCYGDASDLTRRAAVAYRNATAFARMSARVAN